jgi:lipid-binding SYLF domain-containing protein
MTSNTRAIVVMALAMDLMIGCSTGSATKEERDTLVKQSQTARQEWNKVDPQLEAFAKKGQGFVFFPEITKGGLLVGGANGHGVVYEKASISVTRSLPKYPWGSRPVARPTAS